MICWVKLIRGMLVWKKRTEVQKSPKVMFLYKMGTKTSLNQRPTFTRLATGRVRVRADAKSR